MKKMWRLAIPLLLASLLTPALAAWTLAGVNMPDTITINDKQMVLNGMAVRKKVIFKVYVDGLYLPAKEKSSDKILQNDDMRHNVMHFLRSVDKGKISEAWYDGLKANTPNASPELKKQFDLLASWMEDLKDGDRLEYTYIPETGTEVKVKGKVKGTIPGKPFADALFACRIGPKPGPGEGFKKGLLGV